MQKDEIIARMSHEKLSETLKRLLFEKNIKPTELARLTRVPQPTIQRIIAGTTARPHPNSLSPIADYFQITVDQLKGLTPIDWLNKYDSKQTSIRHVPLLAWPETLSWYQQKLDASQHEKVFTDAPVSPRSYALKVEDSSMEPLFPAGTVLIIDAEKTAKDRNYVIAYLSKDNDVEFRQLMLNGKTQYLRPLSPDMPDFAVIELQKNDQIIGVLTQAKHNFDDF